MDPCLNPDYLKPVSMLPAAFQSVFPFRYFNAVQSESFAEVFLSNDNMVISAPTGSGKTVLFELCILRLLGKFLTAEGLFKHCAGARKTVYIAPMKAIVQDKLREWTEKFSPLGIKCQELTSDSGPTNIQEMLDTDIILATPEKFDIITRRHRDRGGMSFFGDIALLLIDEVHLLSEARGAALEAVVSRLKMLARFPEMRGNPLSAIRFVAVSATVPNIEDLAEWLRVSKKGIKRFGEEYRPVRLATTVLGYQPAKNDFLFERRLQHYLLDILMQYSRGRPALVFCSTRKGAQETAASLADTVSQLGNQNPFVKSLDHFDRLQVVAQKTNDAQMQQCIRSGVGYHNGALSMQDRGLVEGLFLAGDLLVLCTTSTLAQGVNLPAHAVIIKSTQYYNKLKGSYVEYERSAILQMSGRAGRPQFDDSGVVIIMTRKDSVHLYQNLLTGAEPVESQLLPSIVEHLNAEIVLMTVSDCSQAIDWLKCSYLYVRIKKNPQHYNIKQGVTGEQLENKLKDICVQNVNELAKYGLVDADEFGFVLTPLEPGRIMEKYYLQFETMKAITKAPDRSSMEDLLQVLANAKELSWIKLRRDEKKKLNDINADTSGRIRFHVKIPNGKLKKRIQTDAEKIFVLVNDALSGEPSALDYTMSQDISGICTNGTRICRCMSDYFIYMKRYREIRNALLLSKCLKQRLWETTNYQLKQIVGVGLVTAKALLTAGLDSFDKLACADPRRLETITGRKFPYGDQLKASLSDIPPKVELNLFENDEGRDQCLLTLRRVSTAQPPAGKSFHMAELVVGSKADNKLLFREKIRMDQFSSPYSITIQCDSASDKTEDVVVAALISEDYVGVDVVCKLAVTNQTRRSEQGLSGDNECQEAQTSMTHFYMSSPFKGASRSTKRSSVSLKSDTHVDSPASGPSAKTKSLDSPTSPRAASSITPFREAPPRYPPRKLIPNPATLATRRFLDGLSTNLENSPRNESAILKDPLRLNGLESTGMTDVEAPSTSVTHPSKVSSSKEFTKSDCPETLTSFHPDNLEPGNSLCSSMPVPANTTENSSCISAAVTPHREVPSRNQPMNIFRRLRASIEERPIKISSNVADKIPEVRPTTLQTEDVALRSSMSPGPCFKGAKTKSPRGLPLHFQVTLENSQFELRSSALRPSPSPTSTLNSTPLFHGATFDSSRQPLNSAGKSAEMSIALTCRNACSGATATEVVTTLPHKNKRASDANLQSQIGADSNGTDRAPEPIEAVSVPSTSSLASLSTPDLLSSNLRRKIRRTGFSSISQFSSADNDVQWDGAELTNYITQPLGTRLQCNGGTDGTGGQENLSRGLKAQEPPAKKARYVTNSSVCDLLSKDFFGLGPDLQISTVTSVSPPQRGEAEPELMILEDISSPPCQQKQSWSTVTNNLSAEYNWEALQQHNTTPKQAPQVFNNDRSTSEPNRTDERLDARLSSQFERSSSRSSPYKELKSFSLGFTWKSTPIVTRMEDEAPEVLDNARNSAISKRICTLEATRREDQDPFTNTLKVPPDHVISRKHLKSFKEEYAPTISRPSSPQSDRSSTTQSAPAGQQEFMGYKSLFSFL